MQSVIINTFFIYILCIFILNDALLTIFISHDLIKQKLSKPVFKLQIVKKSRLVQRYAENSKRHPPDIKVKTRNELT